MLDTLWLNEKMSVEPGLVFALNLPLQPPSIKDVEIKQIKSEGRKEGRKEERKGVK